MPQLDERTAPAQGPLFIVMNAGSGDKDAAKREAAVREVLNRAGRPHHIWRVTDSRELPQLARHAVDLAKRQNGIVVAAGGDGTINAVAQAVLAGGCRFGVLPQGTFNYFSRSHGIPPDPAQAAEILLHGVVRPVQAGLVNGRFFLVNASVGLYPKLLENREIDKQKFGRTRLVALFSALMTLLRRQRQLALSLEEGGEREVMRISTLVVENNPLQLEEVGLPEADAVQQGELAAIVVRARGIPQMLSLLARAALGRLAEADTVSDFSFTSLTVRTPHPKPIKVATDGEINWLVPPLVFRVAPHPLLLVVPPPFATEGVS